MMDTVAATHAVNGRLLGSPVTFMRVTTDSRSIARDDLFIALKGERFDGHDFVSRALAAGAAAAIVADDRVAELSGNLIAVADTQKALGALAQHWRSRFALPVVAVCGSNGKTTTKEMIAAIFREAAGNDHVLATSGNLNNAIGLPLTLLRLRASHKLAVVEIGMNHRGETAELAAIAHPTAVVVTNAQREHQEFMRSVAEVAAEHADAIAALPASGTAVINADDEYADVFHAAARDAKAEILEFGVARRANVTARVSHLDQGSHLELKTPVGDAALTLAIPGAHMVSNALAATAAALAVQIPLAAIVRGLGAFRALDGRLAVRDTAHGLRVIDDSYNANPDSVRAAIDVLAKAGGTRWLVLGDMGEVGAMGPAFHREIGEYARNAGIERLLAVGDLAVAIVEAFGPQATHFKSVDALVLHLLGEGESGDTILVKGSRFMRMERVVAALTGDAEAKAH
ncbi:MAG TPA: UDP-N-acetylmuramoyl-tripeptide--D-alanyl-D-alanine ligase [Casimicrobiaceae bacterium]|nr:UDP-N-acetylmuramoyl-tripeptide--D-alanyl-D-alanine ligase [Casimicrobiaceae bacterium]